MSSKWYFEWDGKTFGPYSSAQFRQLAAIGRLQPTDIVWKEGASRRVRGSQVHGLFPAREKQSTPPKGATAATQGPGARGQGPGNQIVPAKEADATPSAPVTRTRKSGEREEVSSKPKKLSLWPGLEDYQPPADDLVRGLLPDPDSVTLIPVPELDNPPKKAADDEFESDEDDEAESRPSRSKLPSPSRSKHASPGRSKHVSPSRSKHASPPSRSKHLTAKPKDSVRHRSTPKDSGRERSTPKDSVRDRSSTKHEGKDGAGPRK
jgi:hypothetical protein